MDASPQPVLVAVDDDPEALGRIGGELRRRYGDDYRVVCESSSEAVIAELEALRAQGERVALVLADVWMAEQSGSDVLNRVRGLHPHAKRALLIDWGAWGHRPTADSILHAMATGRIDYYVLKPVRSGDEQFHRMVAEFLHEWSRVHSPDAFELAVVADPGSPRTHHLRDLLKRSGVPHGFHNANSAEGRALCEDAGTEPGAVPLVRMRDGRILRDPSNEELVAAFGVDTEPEDDSNFDLIIIGAGPAGLSAAVYASSEGLRTLVIERETIGGQAGSSALIRNYLGFSRGVGGAELAQRAYQQAWVFGTRFAISREVRSLQLERTPFEVGCDSGYIATGSAVLLATGASYRRIGIPALEELTGAGVYYGASTVEGLGLGSEDAYVVGGGNSAGQAALHLARSAGRVTLVVRGATLAGDMSRYLCETISATPNIEVLVEAEVVGGGGEGRLEWLELRDNRTNASRPVSAAAVFILIGARPRTDWLPEAIALDPGGHVLTGGDVLAGEAGELWPLERPPATYETSVPGVFAVGDTRHGAVKRVASAVGEGSVAIPDVHEWLGTEVQPAMR
ncbi:MAG: FAD-dependent oxidoreductase [Solirubrobacterales bacterium]